MPISEVLSKFDTVEYKGFDSYSVIGALSALDEEVKNSSAYDFEILAFSLVPSNHNNNWGTYYGPQMTYEDADNNIIEVPALNDITLDAMSYWEQRYKTTLNPLLTMTYAGLVWDFKQNIFHQKCDSVLYRTYVDSMLKVCKEDYASHPTITCNILERLFHVAKNQSSDLQLVKEAYIDFEKKHAEDNAVRYWSSRFLIMLNNKKFFDKGEIEAIVQEHEQRLNRMCIPVNGKLNPWSIESQAVLLADYYKSHQQREEIKRVLNCLECSFMHEADNMSYLQLLGNLENLHAKYRHYSLEDEAKRLSVELQRLGAKAKSEAQSHKIEIAIPPALRQQAKSMFGSDVEEDNLRFGYFAVYFIPNKANLQASLEEQVKKFPLNFMISNKFLDTKGRPMSSIGSYEKDPEGHLVMHMTQSMTINAIFLDMAIQEMQSCGGLTTDKIMNELVQNSPVFEEERYAIIRKSLDFFFEKDFISFCHLIVPQIENAICNLVSLSGASVLRPQRNATGFQLKTLDELLRDESVVYALKEDGAYYLRLVLTDQRALNIRNSLCHGILPPESFDASVANRLLHVLVLLGLIRYE